MLKTIRLEKIRVGNAKGVANNARKVLAMLFAGTLAWTSLAATWYVAPWGNDDDDGQSWETAMRSPELVVDKWVGGGHTMIISNGTYLLTKAIALSGDRGNLTIRSLTYNPNDVILDAQGLGRCVDMMCYSESLIGVTCTNGVSRNENGGGVRFYGLLSGVMSNCVVTCCKAVSSTAACGGGGVYAQYAQLRNCKVENCSVASENGGGGVSGGGISAANSSIHNCIVRNCGVVGSSNTPRADSVCGGGIALVDWGGATGWPREIVGCEISGCTASNSVLNVQVGCGGGVYCTGSGVVSNCMIASNISTVKGSGAYLSSATLDSCTITNNCLSPMYTAGSFGGSGVFTEGDGADVRRSRIVGNYQVGSASSYNAGGSALAIEGTGTTIENCAVINNRGSRGVGLSFGGNASGTVVSNCLFKGNVGTAADNGGRGAIVFSYNSPGENLIADCYFVDNSGQEGIAGAFYHASVDNSKNGEFKFRNCLITGTSGSIPVWIFHTVKGAVRREVFENCTIVSNRIAASNQQFFDPYYEKDAAGCFKYVTPSNLYLKGCVIAYNGGTAAQISNVMAGLTNIENTCTTGDSWINPNLDQGNFKIDSAKPLFVDAECGDFRPAPNSQLIDRIAPPTWAGTGDRRRGPKDLGSGCDLVGFGEYGVSIVRRSPNPRLYGSKLDIGCFEHFVPPGFLLLLR